jgi:hypothetical protein
MTTTNIINEISAELTRATVKFPTWPTDPLHAVAVLGEEFGELTKAALQLTYEPHKTSAAEVRMEAIQTAAMALRFAMSLDAYHYQPGDQHKQAQPSPDPQVSLNIRDTPAGVAVWAIGDLKANNGAARVACTLARFADGLFDGANPVQLDAAVVAAAL